MSGFQHDLVAKVIREGILYRGWQGLDSPAIPFP
jgi:hypothetical protein